MRNPVKQNNARKTWDKNNAKAEGKYWLNDWNTSIYFATNLQLKVFKNKTTNLVLHRPKWSKVLRENGTKISLIKWTKVEENLPRRDHYNVIWSIISQTVTASPIGSYWNQVRRNRSSDSYQALHKWVVFASNFGGDSVDYLAFTLWFHGLIKQTLKKTSDTISGFYLYVVYPATCTDFEEW